MLETRYIGIVDDHTILRKALTTLINLFHGYEVILEASNGQECIDKLDIGRTPDILLLDVAMPGMNGPETARWLTRRRPEIKILALSTLESESSVLSMIRAGARGYLVKDADPAQLKQAFTDLMAIGYYYNDQVSRQTFRAHNHLNDVTPDSPATPSLTRRENTFLQLACTEKTYNDIAAEMFVSERTVDGYRDSLFRKLRVTTRVGLALYAIKNGLVIL